MSLLIALATHDASGRWPTAEGRRAAENVIDERVRRLCGAALGELPLAPAGYELRLCRLLARCADGLADRRTLTRLFELATLPLYRTAAGSGAARTVLVTGFVFHDGQGDYQHMAWAARRIKAALPTAQVQMLLYLSPHTSQEQQRYYATPPAPAIAVAAHRHRFRHLPEASCEMMQAADLIVEISLRLQGEEQKDAITAAKGEDYLFIGEYGDGSELSLGLEDHQLGIIIKERPTTTSLLDLQDEALRRLLFDADDADEISLAGYLESHEPFVAHLKKGSYYQMTFLYTAVAAMHANGKPTLDLFMPPPYMEFLDRQWLADQGVAQLSVVARQGTGWQERTERLAAAGRELRLIDPYPLAQADFHTLCLHSNPLLGCTGDHTFSEAVSFDRLPFYEIRDKKLPFFKALLPLARLVGDAPFYLEQYLGALLAIYDEQQEQDARFLACGINYDEIAARCRGQQRVLGATAVTIAALLRQPSLWDEALRLNALLRAQYACNDSLADLTARQLAVKQQPALHWQTACDAFVAGASSLGDAQKIILDALEKKNLGERI